MNATELDTFKLAKMLRQRSIELALLLLVAAQSVCFNVVPGFALQILFGIVELAVLYLHLWRVELAPLYIALALNLVASAQSLPSWWWLVWLQASLCVVGILSAIVFPLPSFPPLSAAHPDVGCQTARLHGLDCRIFYPVTRSSHPFTPYLHHGQHLAVGLNTFVPHIPAWFFTSLQNGVLSARADAPLQPSPDAAGWPVVIFSHGLGGALELYSSICQYLASEGMVVVALNHTDGSAAVYRNPDDLTFEYYDRPPPSALEDWDGHGYGLRNKQLHVRAAQIQRVVDAIVGLNNDDRTSVFYQALDLNRIGAAGHSFGGASVLTAAKQDSRIRAVVGLDVWMAPLDKLFGGLNVPVCSIVSQQWVDWKEHHDAMQQFMYKCTDPHTAFLAIEHTRHNNFCDLALFSPVLNKLFRAAGSIEPTYMLDMTSQLTAGYLRHAFYGNQAFKTMHRRFPELLVLNAKLKTTTDDE
ncbi:Aste57867_19044 [Aphanomyces stellatus]|uniref:1-alkyl-2-acetylglycerophosphocholine esterase n=1 Tax=Aphanomyces stellatus TaxID=120398 RepID=A0A485LFW4_9STRA|nr:hypothetical protein As57867_018980 [Aphanomyces stellatus]VFT95769.1 Aste57867_19044 [Aphanomyces stellatus]